MQPIRYLGVLWLMTLLFPSFSLAAANITLTKSADKSTLVNVGDVLIYTMAYENKGDATAQNFKITDNIPAGTSYVPDSSEPRVPLQENPPRLEWNIGSVPPGASGRVRFSVAFGMDTIYYDGDQTIRNGEHVQWVGHNYVVRNGAVTVQSGGILEIGTTGPAMKAVIEGKLDIQSGGQVIIGYQSSGTGHQSTCSIHGDVKLSGSLTVDSAIVELVAAVQGDFIYRFSGGTLVTRNNSVMGGTRYSGRTYLSGFDLSSGRWACSDTTIKYIAGIWVSGTGVLDALRIKAGDIPDAISASSGATIVVRDSTYDVLFGIDFTDPRVVGTTVTLNLPVGVAMDWDSANLIPGVDLGYSIRLYNHTIDSFWWLTVNVASKGQEPDATVILDNADSLGMHLGGDNLRNAPGNPRDFQLPMSWDSSTLPPGEAPWIGGVPVGHQFDTGNLHWRVGRNPANIVTWGVYPTGPNTQLELTGPTGIAELIFREGTVRLRGTPGRHDVFAGGWHFVIGTERGTGRSPPANLIIENALAGVFDADWRFWPGFFAAYDGANIDIRDSRIGIAQMRTGGTGTIVGTNTCTVPIQPPPPPGDPPDYQEFQEGGLIQVPHAPCP